MQDSRLYIVQGRGNDAVGLVGTIAGRIAQAGGNIVDLRQDVLHGLFTLYMVVDLAGTDVRIDDFKALVTALGEDTGLGLEVDRYVPRPRTPGKRNILLILLGTDQPGIIASACEALASYQANIEFSQTIAREGVFLMELLIDVSHATIPLPNLRSAITNTMGHKGIQCVFQMDEVFNKKKRAILFDIRRSLLDSDQLAEIFKHTPVTPETIEQRYGGKAPLSALQEAAGLLEGFPVDVLSSVVEGVTATSDTVELFQTLKVMGYKIVLVSTAFSPITNYLASHLGLDHCFGVPLTIDDDSRTVVGEVRQADYLAAQKESVMPGIVLEEFISAEEVTIISDEGMPHPPGVHLQIDLGRVLEHYNHRAISQDSLLGLLGSFGVPRLAR